MIEVELSRIVIDEAKREQVIVLKEKNGSRMLPIVIGMNEAAAIKMKLSGFNAPRPLTHDLVVSFMESFKARLEKVVIDDLIDGTFHAKLHVAAGAAASTIIDARPSDGVALAVSTDAPIFVEENVFDKLS